jgi:hypothetical protein
VKRIPDGELAELMNAQGTKVSAAINLRDKEIRIEGTLFVPERVARLRSLIVVVRYGLGFAVEQDPQWPRLAHATESGLVFAQFYNVGPTIDHDANRMQNSSAPEALLKFLQRLADESGHREIAGAPVVLWGQSAAGLFEVNFARQYPQRTVAFVHYHSPQIGTVDMNPLSQIPALLLAGGKDTVASPDGIHEFWQRGHSIGAPWTFSLDPESPHGDVDNNPFLKRADTLMIPWLTAVIQQRVAPDGKSLRDVPAVSSWIGNNDTGEISASATFTGSRTNVNWLPDERSARAWQTLRGLDTRSLK